MDARVEALVKRQLAFLAAVPPGRWFAAHSASAAPDRRDGVAMEPDVWIDALDMAPQIADGFASALEAESLGDMLVACAALVLHLIGADEVLLTQLDLANPSGTVVAAGPTLKPDADLTSELVRF